jgi:transporter family protein|uniref:EamA domain-containing protein n=1 Tax=Desulfobacca acetoxidans TaxID=60893 RepID=A0A7C3ZAB8_9BACT
MSAWLALSLLSLGLWGLWGVFSKVATQQVGPQGAYLLGIFGYLPVLALLLYETGGKIPWNPWGWGAALAAGLSTGFGLFFFFRALHQSTASLVVPLTSLYPVVTVFLSWLFLKESLSLRQVLGFVLAMAAVWLMSD